MGGYLFAYFICGVKGNGKSLTLVCFPAACDSMGWGRLEAEGRNAVWVLHVARQAHHLGRYCATWCRHSQEAGVIGHVPVQIVLLHWKTKIGKN